jgi:hypothetical protein
MRRLAITCVLAGCLDWSSLYGSSAVDAPGGSDAPADVGCSDGTREALASFSTIAACGGAWTVQGVIEDVAPACGRHAGNTGSNAAGTGCNVADLCAEGWHVCRGKDDVSAHDGVAACSALAARTTEIYLTRQRGDHTTLMCAVGASTMADDAYGCGGLGAATTNCGPLDHKLALTSNCAAPWGCGTSEAEEGFHIVKSAAQSGGVLCCKD